MRRSIPQMLGNDLGAFVGFCADNRIFWEGESPYGTLQVSINLAKPEKDPQAIALNRESGVAACDLCRENECYDAKSELAQDPRLEQPEFVLDGETWRLHFSPYGYFPYHCIIMSAAHRPMHIDRDCLMRLVSCVERFPYYFVGSNADLPIVGGSILGHDHFQGGGQVFPLMKADIAQELPAIGGVRAGIVQWPASTIRLQAKDPCALAVAVHRILEVWQAYDDEAAGIKAQSAGGELHSTITPICYLRSFATGDARDADTWVMDVVLRNNRCTEQRPYGLFHPDESLHHIKKENIGLIEIMGLAILPPRLLREIPGIERDAAVQREVTRSYVKILESTSVLVAQGSWERFLAVLYGSSSAGLPYVP